MSNGQVTINDSPTKSKLYRYCEKKIDQWVQTRIGDMRHSGPEPESAFEFRVSFTEESDSRQVSCVTEIQLGNSTWRGWDLAPDTQMAFMHSLKRLQPHALN